jgi:hypothetical protein
MTKHAWDDNNYEGKAIRRVFSKLLKKFENNIDDPEIDLEEFQKMAQTLSTLARTKADLAYKKNRIDDKIKLLESMIPPDIKKGTIIEGVKEIAGELPSKPT